MSVLLSDRIRTIALTPHQVCLQLRNRTLLEKELDLFPNNIEMEEDFEKEFNMALEEHIIPKLKENPENYKWFTSWVIVHNAHRKIIGGIGTGGMPNHAGEIIIGYFIDKKFRKQRFAQEAVGVFVNYLLGFKSVLKICATIPFDHTGSERVVEANGFIIESQLEEGGMQLNKWVLHRQ